TGKHHARVALALPEDVPGLGWAAVVLACGTGLLHGCHGPGLRKSEPSRFVPDELILAAPPSAPAEEVREATVRAGVEGRAVALARELVNTPPCDLYPQTFAEQAQAVAASAGIDCVVFDEKRLEAERMGALLAVARGSDRPPRLVVLRYRNGTNRRTL